MDNQAVHPTGNPILQIFSDLKSEQMTAFDALKEKDELWKKLAESPFLPLLKSYITNLVDHLDNLEGEAFANGASSDEIVMRRAVYRLTKANLFSIITKIEQTAEGVRGTAPARPTVS